ncbi:GNAT family N-acetyltransferase [Alicyclobacillus macrosporangiidus]|jgi:RimJ/RimL family protein N-acetyltransferase|uniref:Acetyltransferase (GNAT) domain-containing protein n=1 Tax=Alicyclobacillus macrosporangiidus TaxID=392015 RepID=A0A1I7J4Y3_9BACL|nr:GNAT family N-acetyltransferase [Alicyclobacillus macrosporangiidus]SFU80238.1 Acetyltransferase (GNAT) domain-containing protein [Alicyclobacillus macrosporangiidus]
MGFVNPQVVILPNGTAWTLRTAEPADAPQVLEHTKQVIGETDFLITTSEEITLTVDEERAWIQEHLDDPGSLLLIASAGSQVIGILSFRRESRARLSHHGSLGVSVQKAWHRQGIGRKMMETLLRWAEANPEIEKVCLEVFTTNEPAIRLYQSLGFQEEGRRRRHVKLGPNAYVDTLLMCKFVK